MKIGIYDSGIGGLSVLYTARKFISNADFIYYADTDNVPYGEKSKEEIEKCADNVMRFFSETGADAVVIACNTATSAAVDYLRAKYTFPIIGMEPAIKKAVDTDRSGKILVTATPFTLIGDKFAALTAKLDVGKKADMLALPGLVRFAEKGKLEGKEVEDYIRSSVEKLIFEKYSNQGKEFCMGEIKYSTVVLGCTHFIYFKREFKKVLGEDVNIVDGNEGTARQLLRRIKEECGYEEETEKSMENAEEKALREVEFFVSGRKADAVVKQSFENYLEYLDKLTL